MLDNQQPDNLPTPENEPLPVETPVEKPRRRFILRMVARYALYGMASLFVLSILVVMLGRWIPPATSSFMIRQRLANTFQGNGEKIHYTWTRWRDISPDVALAVVAAEDQKFPLHHGFDIEAISKAREENVRRARPRGASTITQQVAKNLYLWPGRSYIRKGLEAYFTILIELLWSKKRILEVYINIAEFGPNIYGVGAAAETFWGTTPAQLTRRQAALLAAVLPSPKKLHADNPSEYVEQRVHWIEVNMLQLGGSYLKSLY